MSRTRIKICGVRDVETALVAVGAGADAVGLVFAPGSPRTIEDLALAEQIAGSVPVFADAVGLFVDAGVDGICEVLEACPLDAVQLHGNETPDEARAVAEATGVRIIKAVRFDETTIENTIAKWNDAPGVSALLIDGSAGGAGTAFDWEALAQHTDDIDLPLIVAGGLTPDNVGDAVGALWPYGVDVSSGVESSRGVKDEALIRAFCAAVMEADFDDEPGD